MSPATSISPEEPARQTPRFAGPQVILQRPRFWSDGSAIETLPPGWSVRDSRPLSHDLHLFELEVEDGTARSWFANRAGRLICRRPEQLSGRQMASLRQYILEHGPLSLHGEAGPDPLDSNFLSEIVRSPIVQAPDGLTVQDAAGAILPIRLPDGQRVAHLDAGWSARLLYAGFRPLLVLDLAHTDGRRTGWFIDETGRFIQTLELADPAVAAGLAGFAARNGDPRTARSAQRHDGYHMLGSAIRIQLEALLAQVAADPAGAADAEASPIQHQEPVRPYAMPPLTVPLVEVEHLQLRSGGCVDRRLSDRWLIRDDVCLCLGSGADLSFTLPHLPIAARLSLDLRAIGGPREVTVTANGWQLARFGLRPEGLAIARRDVWIPRECLADLSLRLELAFDGPDETVACGIEDVTLDVGPAVPPVEIPPAGEMIGRFGSLGFACEFGFVQRRFGIEPLGLFRFSNFYNMRNLIRLIETDFAGMGSPGSLIGRNHLGRIVQADGSLREEHEWFIDAPGHSYGFHTWEDPTLRPLEEALADNERKIAYLARAMIEDLEDGEKIWIFNEVSNSDHASVFSLHHALNRKRPNKLFWVTRPIEGRPAGAVEWIGPNLLRGYSGQPHRDAQVFDPEMWRALCEKAYRAFAERPST